jgi:hypothetical protein
VMGRAEVESRATMGVSFSAGTSPAVGRRVGEGHHLTYWVEAFPESL